MKGVAGREELPGVGAAAVLAALVAAGGCLDVGPASEGATATARFQLQGGWYPTGEMASRRSWHTATLLPSGRVLVLGGWDEETWELYDPATGTWTISEARGRLGEHPTATLLHSGRVLVLSPGAGSAALYDPATDMWTLTERPLSSHFQHTATLLPSGRVLVAGSDVVSGVSAELYDPATETWTATGSMLSPRSQHTATLLPSGRVLVVGGAYYDDGRGAEIILATAELYDPATGTWTATGAMISPRVEHTATLLLSGRVLVAGGRDGSSVLATAELYDPATETWMETDLTWMESPRRKHTATLLPWGHVLVAGGYYSLWRDPWPVAELYDPDGWPWLWTETGTLDQPEGHTATLLPSGRVLVAGGTFGGLAATAQLYEVTGSTSGDAAACRVCEGNGTCVVIEDDFACSDGDACTVGDACRAGTCVPVMPLPCDDGNPCTVDSCNAITGCTITATPGVPCDDGNDDTLDDVCRDDTSCAGTPRPQGCGCRAVAPAASGATSIFVAAAFTAVFLRGLRRRRTRRVAFVAGRQGGNGRFRRTFVTVVGRADKDFQKLRASKAAESDEDDDPAAPAAPSLLPAPSSAEPPK